MLRHFISPHQRNRHRWTATWPFLFFVLPHTYFWNIFFHRYNIQQSHLPQYFPTMTLRKGGISNHKMDMIGTTHKCLHIGTTIVLINWRGCGRSRIREKRMDDPLARSIQQTRKLSCVVGVSPTRLSCNNKYYVPKGNTATFQFPISVTALKYLGRVS